jgi:hypothetical protein
MRQPLTVPKAATVAARLRYSLVGALVALTLSCGGGGGSEPTTIVGPSGGGGSTVTAASVTLSPSTLTLPLGTADQLTATPKAADGHCRGVAALPHHGDSGDRVAVRVQDGRREGHAEAGLEGHRRRGEGDA